MIQPHLKNQGLSLLLALASLLFGLFIYTLARPESLYLNQWIKAIIGPGHMLSFRDFLAGIAIPSWMMYSLPDALWMLSLMLIMLVIWRFQINRQSMPWILATLVFGIGFEALQANQWVRGSFDWMDLVMIFAAGLLPVCILLFKQAKYRIA